MLGVETEKAMDDKGKTAKYEPSDRQLVCRHSFICVGLHNDETHCELRPVGGVGEGEPCTYQVVTNDDCGACADWDSQHLEDHFPIKVSSIVCTDDVWERRPIHGRRGTPVAVTVCEEDGTRSPTYLGIYLGELPIQPHVSWDRETEALTIRAYTNPGIWVPALSRIVWGAESFWHEIDDHEKLREITDKDIQGAWYMQAIAGMSGNGDETEEEP